MDEREVVIEALRQTVFSFTQVSMKDRIGDIGPTNHHLGTVAPGFYILLQEEHSVIEKLFLYLEKKYGAPEQHHINLPHYNLINSTYRWNVGPVLHIEITISADNTQVRSFYKRC